MVHTSQPPRQIATLPSFGYSGRTVDYVVKHPLQMPVSDDVGLAVFRAALSEQCRTTKLTKWFGALYRYVVSQSSTTNFSTDDTPPPSRSRSPPYICPQSSPAPSASRCCQPSPYSSRRGSHTSRSPRLPPCGIDVSPNCKSSKTVFFVFFSSQNARF